MMSSTFLPSISDMQSFGFPYGLQTVKPIFQGPPDALASFWATRKNQKTGRETREKSKAATGNKGPITTAFAKISPTKVQAKIALVVKGY